jgi:hypothetical protein
MFVNKRLHRFPAAMRIPQVDDRESMRTYVSNLGYMHTVYDYDEVAQQAQNQAQNAITEAQVRTLIRNLPAGEYHTSINPEQIAYFEKYSVDILTPEAMRAINQELVNLNNDALSNNNATDFIRGVRTQAPNDHIEFSNDAIQNYARIKCYLSTCECTLKNPVNNKPDEFRRLSGKTEVIKTQQEFENRCVVDTTFENPVEKAFRLDLQEPLPIGLEETPKVNDFPFNSNFCLHIPLDRIVWSFLMNPQREYYLAALSLLKDEDITHNVPLLWPNLDTRCFDRTNGKVNINQVNRFRASRLTKGIGEGIVDAQEPISTRHFVAQSLKPVSDLMEKLLAESITTLSSTEEFKNYGFDVGISGHGLRGGCFLANQALSGGASNYSIELYIDTNAVPSGLSMADRLKSSYGESIKLRKPTTIIYNSLFKGINTTSDNGNLIFSLIINYFHVYNVSFSSIYNGLCFPSILYNASVMSFAINRFADALTTIDLGTSDGMKSQMFKFFKEFFRIFGTSEFLARTADPINQINYLERRDKMRPDTYSYASIVNNQNSLKDIVKDVYYYASMHTYPCVSSDFVSFALKLMSPNYASNNHTLNDFDLSPFFASNFLSGIRHLDILTTYICVVFSLMKQTTRFSSELNVDMSTFSVDNPEPFSIEYEVSV